MEGLEMNRDFWRGKKVLVTGHTGFKGGWLSLWLQSMGAEVIGVSVDPPSKPSLYQQANIADGMISLYQDIREGDKLKDIFNQYKPEIVFHLAAQPLVRYSYREPIETYETNVMGTLHLLEAIRDSKSTHAAVIITTDKCYENHEWEWGYRENEPMGGYDLYSSSKGAVELLVASYRRSYFSQISSGHYAAIASVRAGNVIGGGDWAEDRLIPDIVRAFQKNKPVLIRNPYSIRPWQHVVEPLYGYLLLAEHLFKDGMPYAEPWNFGPLEEDARPVEWIVDKMKMLWGDGVGWEIDDGKHPHEANYLKLDCSKAHNRLLWWPKWSLEIALEKTIEWHKGIQSNSNDAKELTISQIHSYVMDQ